MRLAAAKARAETANKAALEAEKAKDAAEEEVEALRRAIDPKRARTEAGSGLQAQGSASRRARSRGACRQARARRRAAPASGHGPHALCAGGGPTMTLSLDRDVSRSEVILHAHYVVHFDGKSDSFLFKTGFFSCGALPRAPDKKPCLQWYLITVTLDPARLTRSRHLLLFPSASAKFWATLGGRGVWAAHGYSRLHGYHRGYHLLSSMHILNTVVSAYTC